MQTDYFLICEKETRACWFFKSPDGKVINADSVYYKKPHDELDLSVLTLGYFSISIYNISWTVKLTVMKKNLHGLSRTISHGRFKIQKHFFVL